MCRGTGLSEGALTEGPLGQEGSVGAAQGAGDTGEACAQQPRCPSESQGRAGQAAPEGHVARRSQGRVPHGSCPRGLASGSRTLCSRNVVLTGTVYLGG